MPDESKLLSFYQELEGEISDHSLPSEGAGTAKLREYAFTNILADELEASGVLESPVVCHDEGGQGASSFKVNGYGVPEEDSRLDLFTTLYFGPSAEIQTINSAHIDAGMNKAERYLGRSLKGRHEEIEPGLDPFAMAQAIHGLKGKVDRVNFLLFTNGRLSQRREKERKPEIHGLAATYEVWDIERFRRLRESGTSYEALNVDLRQQPRGGLPAVCLAAGDGSFQTWVTVFPGRLLADLYDEHGSRLLELNVRSYLQARGKVNKGILETLRQRPEDFMAYNNGITVVAEEVIAGNLNDGTRGIHALQGMQIVNGGQTTASIHRASRDFGADLSRVYVQGKITVVDPGHFQDVVPFISQYSNTQNKVSTSDLSANHAFHIGMERVSRREWTPNQQSRWFYERARGSYQTAKIREGATPAKRREFDQRYPVQQRFTKEDLAKFENAWRGEPHWVSKGAQKNFVHFMERIGRLPDGWEPAVEEYRRYVAKGILFREVQKIVRNVESITAYRINVSAYTAALLTEKTARRIDLDRIWNQQGISKTLVATIESWAPLVFRHLPEPARQAGKHVEESFKTQGCWDFIRNLDLQVTSALEKELVSAVDGAQVDGTPTIRGRSERLSPQDHNNIALCKELGESLWLKIAGWGQESGTLAEWQRGIARTLAGYAAENWNRSPSPKQAKHGAQMIEKARAEGLFAGD
jgi:hypothetical protein